MEWGLEGWAGPPTNARTHPRTPPPPHTPTPRTHTHSHARAAQERKRREEVEARLEGIQREASAVRLQLRRLGVK